MDDFSLDADGISLTPPDGLTDAERTAWIQGFKTGQSLIVETASTYFEGVTAERPQPKVTEMDDPIDGQPPCPDCGQPMRGGLKDDYTCLSCGLSLQLTSPPE